MNVNQFIRSEYVSETELPTDVKQKNGCAKVIFKSFTDKGTYTIDVTVTYHLEVDRMGEVTSYQKQEEMAIIRK